MITETVAAQDVPLDRDLFLRQLVRELSGALEDVVGLEEASGYISLVGAAMGEQIGASYRRALKVERLGRDQLGAVLVDLKRRIEGDFYIIEETPERIVLGNRACPFAEKVLGRPSMCMMTSNVFGRIAADTAGYARVEIEAAIARGDPGCRVVIHLDPSTAPDAGGGREYFRVS
ncbi:methanogen output domain 1-containing protein [Rhodospirillales bacterium YIM 152171]|uniref:Methanogen output domain 1-containing protein n=2 Tax=Marinimicrococcus flavescens TaxID=3031815 RepID=A0AAP3V0E0_9PROT|nr:methanogen output domain 1-containing protein [Marinimicrococcus flavescens]